MPRAVSNSGLLLGALLTVVAALAMVAFASHPLDTLSWLAERRLRWQGFEEHRIEGARGPIALLEGGSGPPLVLVHGFGDRAMGWRSVLVPLSQTHRVIAPDLAGHGRSAPSGDQALSLEDTLDSLRRVVDERSPGEPVILVGNSLGGWISALYALESPERVEHLVLVNSGGLAWPLDRDALLPSTREGVRRKLERLFGPAAPRLPDFVLDDLLVLHADPGLHALFDDVERAGRLDERARELQVPTSIVWGRGDGFFPDELGRRWHAAVPGSRLAWLDGCAHVPQFTCPDGLVAAVSASLVEGRRASAPRRSGGG